MEDILQISNIHFEIALNSEHVAGFGRVRSASADGSWLKKKIED